VANTSKGRQREDTGDIEERAVQLAMAAERIRERTYASAHIIEIAPIRNHSANKLSAEGERTETLARKSSFGNNQDGETRRVKIEEIKTEPKGGSRVTKIEKKIKSERIDISEDRGKTKRKD